MVQVFFLNLKKIKRTKNLSFRYFFFKARSAQQHCKRVYNSCKIKWLTPLPPKRSDAILIVKAWKQMNLPYLRSVCCGFLERWVCTSFWNRVGRLILLSSLYRENQTGRWKALHLYYKVEQDDKMMQTEYPVMNYSDALFLWTHDSEEVLKHFNHAVWIIIFILVC